MEKNTWERPTDATAFCFSGQGMGREREDEWPFVSGLRKKHPFVHFTPIAFSGLFPSWMSTLLVRNVGWLHLIFESMPRWCRASTWCWTGGLAGKTGRKPPASALTKPTWPCPNPWLVAGRMILKQGSWHEKMTRQAICSQDLVFAIRAEKM